MHIACSPEEFLEESLVFFFFLVISLSALYKYMSVDQYLWIYFLYCRTDVTRLWGNLFAVLILWGVQTRLSSSQYTITWTAMSWTPDIISLTLSINLSAYTATLSFHKHRNFIIPQIPSLYWSTSSITWSFYLQFIFIIPHIYILSVILLLHLKLPSLYSYPCSVSTYVIPWHCHIIGMTLPWYCHVAMTFPQCHHITILP